MRERLYFFFCSTLTDCMFVSLAVAPFMAGIKACREPEDLIGNLGEKQKGGWGVGIGEKNTLAAAVLYGCV